ncbi:MAG: peptidase M15 [Spirochaetae bacterium HGW-Spirochaetae-5]|nr:MAG: peptidase M15 [Spirochaetae bacterium HGW-Spirochaetae-5]
MLRKLITLTFLITIISILRINVISKETGIQAIPVFDYVTGRFDPSKHEDFINIKKTPIPCSGDMYLRKETAKAWQILINDFKKEHPKIKIIIQSATRNYNSQKSIWEGKWNGKRPTTGIKDITKITDPLIRALRILDYSSMPGTSRHHWGTDFDINTLNNAYYSNGDGKIIYQWLKKNAANYGFGQPYTEGRETGYNEEKWHWSYLPLSAQYLNDWNRVYKDNPDQFTRAGLFSGSDKAGHLSPEYVNSINPECK